MFHNYNMFNKEDVYVIYYCSRIYKDIGKYLYNLCFDVNYVQLLILFEPIIDVHLDNFYKQSW